MAKKARKAKAAGKKKTGKKSAVRKKPSAKKSAPAKKAKKKTARVPKPAATPPAPLRTVAFSVPVAAAPPPKPAAPKVAPPHDPDILAAVGVCVDKFMDDAPHPGWSNSDLVTKFKYTPATIVRLLTTVQACLLPTYQFTIPKGFAKKCTSDTETMFLMKYDISLATIKP